MLDGFQTWRRRITAELTALPDTLAQFREGVENFQRVAKRLADSTESLEQINQLQAGALKALRDQIAKGPASSALMELTESLARLNPFWPKGQSG